MTPAPTPRPDSRLAPLRFAVVLMLVFGLAYPLVVTVLAGALFPRQANGSLITRDGTVVGSRLVGQAFSGPQYFIGRPSAAGAGYDPTSASGSNLAPSNPDLNKRVRADAAAIAAREGVPESSIPVDLVTASGSGLDPDISPEGAALQVRRVARARGLSEDVVRAAVERHTAGGLLGPQRVNVLELNLDLDELK